MDDIVKKLSEIERAAQAIVVHAEEEKQKLEREIQAARDEFDNCLEEKTLKELDDIREGLKRQRMAILARQQRQNASVIEALKKDFEEKHSEYAREVMNRIIEE